MTLTLRLARGLWEQQHRDIDFSGHFMGNRLQNVSLLPSISYFQLLWKQNFEKKSLPWKNFVLEGRFLFFYTSLRIQFMPIKLISSYQAYKMSF